MAIAGPSGAGKSSLAVALVQQGAHPYCDDVISVEPETGLVPFGTSRAKLNPDMLAALDLEGSFTAPVYQGIDKRCFHFPVPEDTRPGRLAAIYCLAEGAVGEDHPVFLPVPDFPKVIGIMSQVFRVELEQHAWGAQELIRRSSLLAKRTHLFTLKRTKTLGSVQQLAESLREHARSLPDDV